MPPRAVVLVAHQAPVDVEYLRRGLVAEEPWKDLDPERSRILVAAFASGWLLNKPGLGVFVVVPDDYYQPWKRATVPFAKSVSLWSFAMLAATSALRRTRLPTPISAVVLGGGMLVADSLLSDLGESRDSATAAQAHVEVQSVADDKPDTVGAQQLGAPEEGDVAP